MTNAPDRSIHPTRSRLGRRARAAACAWLAGLALCSAAASCFFVRPAPPFAPACVRVTAGYGPRGAVPFHVETVATGLEVPWAIAFLPDGDLLVTERPGRLRRVHAGRLLPQPVLRVAVTRQAEDGLLGLALHPAFATNRLLYLYYTRDTPRGPVNRLERYRLAPDGARATSDRVLLDDVPAARFHNGGRIRFGPDGMLYVGTGDAREPDRAARDDSLAGKLLRLTPDGGVPADNPWPGRLAFARGLRNAAAFDFRADGTIVLADHGPSGEMLRAGHDEIDVVTRGADLGWPAAWGCEARDGRVAPALSWDATVPPGGASFYTGVIGAWRGSFMVATLAARHLHRVVFDPRAPGRVIAHEVYLAGDPPNGLGRLRDAVMGPDGALYLTTSNCDGRGRCPGDGDRIVRLLP